MKEGGHDSSHLISALLFFFPSFHFALISFSKAVFGCEGMRFSHGEVRTWDFRGSVTVVVP